MRLLLVGGIFGSSDAFRKVNLQQTTETLLADTLPAHGIDVVSASHRGKFNVFDFDVVHIHHLATGCVRMLVQILLRPWKRRPVIVFTRHATKELPWTHEFVLRAMQRCADALVVLSTQEHTIVRKQSRRPSKVYTIPNGIDATHFFPAPRVRPDKGAAWRLLYVGQLIELKRVDIAVRALYSLIAAGHDAELHIVSHRETLRPQLEELATSLGIRERITFHPPATRADVGAHMRDAHLLLLPSRTEALPTVIIEAGLTGLPTVAFDVGGVRSLMPGGIKVPDRDSVIEFIDLVQEYLSNYSEVCEIFAADRDRLATEFSVPKMAERHASLYRSLLLKRKGPGCGF